MAQAAQKQEVSASVDDDSDIEASVVVPVYNEEHNVHELLGEIQAVFLQDSLQQYRPYEVVFVDDGSTDGTADRIQRAATDQRMVKSVHLQSNFGQSAALAAGFDVAVGQYIIPMDGDLQNDPADIPELLNKLDDGYDCVSGWRRDRDDPWHKTIPSAVQTRLAKLTGPDINDFGCTLKAYRREALEDIDLYGEGHRYIPSKLYDKGYSVTELEVNHRARKNGSSHYGVSRLARGFLDLMFHWFWVRYSTRPMHLFGLTGMLIMTAGFALGGLLLVNNFVLGGSLMPKLPELILSVSMTLFGVMLFALGVIGEMLTKIIYRDDSEYRIEEIVG